MNTSPYLIRVDHLHFTNTSNRKILNDINFTISPEEITTVIGPNGAGKSTLIKLIAGLLTPTDGKIDKKTNLSIGYVPQKISLNNNMPLKVSRFLSLAGIDRTTRSAVLKRLNIEHLKSAQMQALSGGEFQRVLLARAISRKPELLILDEPLQGIDVNGQIELYQLIAEMRTDLGCAVVMVSHDLHLVMAQTDSVICLNHHICCHGKPESVSQHPEYIKLFGQHAAQNIAVYTHHHDHHHDIHGDPIKCGDECDHT